MKILKFDLGLYPQNVWIVLFPDNGLLDKKFETSNGETTFTKCVEPKDVAATHKVRERSTNETGVMIIFGQREDITFDVVAHECVHAAGFVFEYIGQDVTNDECFAYLVGFIANCCQKLKKSWKNI